MKFSCERCGKRYASAQEPISGRVYRLTCKACGHLIRVRGAAEEGAARKTARANGDRAADAGLAVGTPEASSETPSLHSASPPVETGTRSRAPVRFDAAHEISMLALEAQPAIAPEPPAGEAPKECGYVELGPEVPRGGEARGADALAGISPASLPEGYGEVTLSPDPLARPRDVAGAGARERTPRAREELRAPKLPIFPKPAKQKSTGPLLLIGVGSLALIGILAFVLLRGSPPPAPSAPAKAATGARPEPAAPARR